MALIVEDGTVTIGANSYVTESEADEYFDARGNEAWLVDDSENEAKLIEAADYLNIIFTWPGDKYNALQPMALPTSALEAIPSAVKQAQMILALEAKSGPLVPSFQGPTIESERKKLEGVGEKEVKYNQAVASNARRFPLVEALLRGCVVTSTGSSFQTARRLLG